MEGRSMAAFKSVDLCPRGLGKKGRRAKEEIWER